MPVELLNLRVELGAELAVYRLRVVEDVVEDGHDPLALVSRQPNSHIVVQHRIFHVLDRQKGQAALMLLPTTAVVIEVQSAGVALSAQHDQALVTAVTEQHALEVVVMDTSARAASTLRVDERLNLVEQLALNQRFVSTGVLAALVADKADVEAVTQHGSQLVDGQFRSGRRALRLAGAKSRVRERFSERPKRVRASRVELECQLDQGCALRIDRDGSDLATLELLADVQVAEWRTADGATVLDLLPHFVGDICAGRSGLVLVNAVQHGRDEVTDCRVFGVVHDRNQDRAGVLEVALGNRGIDRVSVQPRTGVDNHIVNVLLGFDPRHHVLEAWAPVGRSGGPSRLDVLLDDVCTQLRRTLLNRRPLSG